MFKACCLLTQKLKAELEMEMKQEMALENGSPIKMESELDGAGMRRSKRIQKDVSSLIVRTVL